MEATINKRHIIRILNFRREHIGMIMAWLIIFYFGVYVCNSVREFGLFQAKMQRQVFDVGMSQFLSYAVPVVLSAIIGLLWYKPTRKWGLLLSMILLLVFIVYIKLVLRQFFDKEACSCIAIKDGMGWKGQLWLNYAALLIASTGALLTRKGGKKMDP
ncbi:hypothetical protein SAMN05216436_10344 [bacterium A37T11]|nr:hypothetical protein SAMN05216436_10344 [bacterium A37T11]